MPTLHPFAVASWMLGILVASAPSGATVAHAAPVPEPPIAWGPCAEPWVGATSDTLGERLECGSMRAPLDHVAPDGRTMDVGVIRVRARNTARREGVIFFNPGGPGLHPGSVLRSIASGWTGEAAGAGMASKRQLSERFDFVTVIPRGLTGSSAVNCVTGLPPRHAYLPTHLDDANWGRVLVEATTAAAACAALEYTPYINTEQHVHDMDMLRRALGDERIHIYGISYGGMIAAWYASIYPENTGRILLDSTIDFTHDYRTAIRLSMIARNDAFVCGVLNPLIAHASRYGLDPDPDVIKAALASLPSRIREIWRWDDSELQLAVALHVGALWHNARPTTYAAMAALIQRTAMTQDAALAGRMRREALQLATALYAPSPSLPLDDMDAEEESVRLIVVCNDIPQTRSDAEIRATARSHASRYWTYSGSETVEELICSRWSGGGARQPVLATMAQAAPFLLLQSADDVVTPPGGAAHILEDFTNAHLLLVRHSSTHGLFNFTLSPCIEKTAADYLLTGTIPASGARSLACIGTHGSALYAIPGDPSLSTEAPVPIGRPARHHDEL
ncbi:alpha/beta fold hydrolase [Luteibacter yeojuensis]|uniref:Alpha/beta hydrolase n=1 Tax=Luteibacter yeojuensis TaxID=345309 RepID=A0A7X5TR33_9GAMM|nr:alpha/beta hydrolase [Luteibacter yeojuensis]NID16459.1 alpha/beta hydrolase [Luteibacter yeojuensis]